MFDVEQIIPVKPPAIPPLEPRIVEMIGSCKAAADAITALAPTIQLALYAFIIACLSVAFFNLVLRERSK